MSRPKFGIGDIVKLNRGFRDRWSHPREIMDIHEHQDPVPSTDYWGNKLSGRFVYKLDDWTDSNGWVHEEQITGRPPQAIKESENE